MGPAVLPSARWVLLEIYSDFSIIVAPLMHLLRRDAFAWDDHAEAAFQALKGTLTTGPVLQMLDFNKVFMVDSDALGAGFGAVLHHGAGPLAFFSRPFATRHHKLAAYERELIGLVQAIRHWRPYLWRDILLFALIITASNTYWTSACQWCHNITGLVNSGFDFAVARTSQHGGGRAVSMGHRGLPGGCCGSSDGGSLQVIVLLHRRHLQRYCWCSGRSAAAGTLAGRQTGHLLARGRGAPAARGACLRHLALQLAHGAGYEGVQKTLHRLRSDFYIPGDHALVQDWVRICATFQCNKTEAL